MCVVAVIGARLTITLPLETPEQNSNELPILQPLPVKLEPFELPQTEMSDHSAARILIAAH